MTKNKKIKKITISIVLSWIFGILFGLTGILTLFKGAFVSGLSLILASLILLPPLIQLIKDHMNIELSRGLRRVLVIILFFLFAFNIPDTSTEDQISITRELDPLKGNSESVNQQSIACKDECSQSMCFGLDYQECRKLTDGCTHKMGLVKVKGKCGVECKYDSDCNSDESCNLYKCESLYNKMNTDVEVDYLTYKVFKAETFTSMGGSYFEKTTNGKFVKVYMSITNNAKETKEIYSDRFKIIDNQDRKYDRLSDTMMYIEDYIGFGTQLQPGLDTFGAIVFEMPKDSEKLILEIVGDAFSISKELISLEYIDNIKVETSKDDALNEQMEDYNSQMEDLMNQLS